MQSIVIVVHLVAAVGIVLMVLLQQGKGADAGASFGSGASATVFGSQGASTFFSRITAILAAVFFVTSLGLAFFANQQVASVSDAGLPDPEVLDLPTVDSGDGDIPVLESVEPKTGSSDSSDDLPVVPEQ